MAISVCHGKSIFANIDLFLSSEGYTLGSIDVGDAYLMVEQEEPTVVKVDGKYYELGPRTTKWAGVALRHTQPLLQREASKPLHRCGAAFWCSENIPGIGWFETGGLLDGMLEVSHSATDCSDARPGGPTGTLDGIGVPTSEPSVGNPVGWYNPTRSENRRKPCSPIRIGMSAPRFVRHHPRGSVTLRYVVKRQLPSSSMSNC